MSRYASHHYDVIVIGAGGAGLRAAVRSRARGLRVAVTGGRPGCSTAERVCPSGPPTRQPCHLGSLAGSPRPRSPWTEENPVEERTRIRAGQRAGAHSVEEPSRSRNAQVVGSNPTSGSKNLPVQRARRLLPHPSVSSIARDPRAMCSEKGGAELLSGRLVGLARRLRIDLERQAHVTVPEARLGAS